MITRQTELKELQALYETDGNNLVLLTGTLESGREDLIREFCEGKPALYFRARNASDDAQREAFLREVTTGAGVKLHESITKQDARLYESAFESYVLQNREKLRAVQRDIQLEAEERSESDCQIRGRTTEGLSSARETTSRAVEHLQEQIDLTASELQRANISNWRKIRELDAEDINLHEEIRDTEQKLHAETTDAAAAIRQEIQDDISGLGRNLTRQTEHLQEQADELSGVVITETRERRKDNQKLRQKITDAAAELEELVANEASLREEKDEKLSGSIETSARQSKVRAEHLQKQADENAQASIQMAFNLLQEAEYRRRDIQNTQEKIDAETQERVKDTSGIRSVHEADVSRLEDADSIAAKIRHDEDSGLQEQINELAYLRLQDELKNREEHLKAIAGKHYEDLQQQSYKEHQSSQINELAAAVLQLVLNIYKGFGRLKSHTKLIETALVDWGVLDEDDIPPMTEVEIDGMLEDIFSGNASGEAIEPEDEDEAEFLEDINSIFNP